MFIRAKIVKDEIYYQVIEGYRDAAGRVRQRTIISLGREPTIEDAIAETKRLEGRYQRRLKKLTRLCPAPATMPGWMRREIAKLPSRLTQQRERRDRLREVAKRLPG